MFSHCCKKLLMLSCLRICYIISYFAYFTHYNTLIENSVYCSEKWHLIMLLHDRNFFLQIFDIDLKDIMQYIILYISHTIKRL